MRLPKIEFVSDRRADILQLLKSNTKVDKQTGCFLWTGTTSGKIEEGKTGRGYGRISLGGATMAVHRVSWTNFFGIIPHKKQIDHKCNNRLCWNPAHLELVTHKKNCKRRDKRRKKNVTD